jgi:hypothetical protein
LRYLLLTARRTRAPLLALAATLFALLGVYAYRPNEVGATWGLTALICSALAAWLVGAVLDGEPGPQADITNAALGGRSRRDRLDLLLVAAVAAGLTVTFVAYPLALGLILADPPVFRRAVQPGDVVAATLAHASCGALGGAIAVLFAAPRVARRATAVAAVLTTLLGLIAISGPLGEMGGPLAVARAMTDADAGGLDGALLLACLSCLAATAVVLAVAARWARRSG